MLRFTTFLLLIWFLHNTAAQRPPTWSAAAATDDHIDFRRKQSFIKPQRPRFRLPPAAQRRYHPPPPTFPDSSNIVQTIFAQSQQSPFDPLASATSPIIEHISTLARNLLQLPAANQQQLLTALASALAAPPQPPALPVAAAAPAPNLLAALLSTPQPTTLPSATAQQRIAEDLDALEQLPAEQRKLLLAAITSGELSSEPTNLIPAINAVVSQHRLSSGKSRIEEWIEKNRLALTTTTTVAPALLPEPVVFGKATTPSPSPSPLSTIGTSSERLPYYGKYCGSLTETQANSRYGAKGSVWLVDDRRLLVSKFNFQPAALRNENITFWAGPAEETDDLMSDMFPSGNGFYVQPAPLDLQTFLATEKRIVIGRKRRLPTIDNTTTNSTTSTTTTTTSKPEKLSDHNVEFGHDDETSLNAIRRQVRNIYYDDENNRSQPSDDADEEFRQRFYKYEQSQWNQQQQPNNASIVQLIVQDGVVTAPTLTLPPPLPPRKTKETKKPPLASTTTTTSTTNTTTTTTTTTTTNTTGTSASSTSTTTSPSTTITTTTTIAVLPTRPPRYEPLGWFAGYQPLLLTIPESSNKRVRDLRWLAIYDHDHDTTIAYVLIPNAPAFRIPSIVTLRGLTSNGLRQLSSGPIQVINTKTIRIEDFLFDGEGPEAWFVVGKDLLPNPNGQIVPIYDEERDSFDCDYLRAYNGSTTLTLRLPAGKYWFDLDTYIIFRYGHPRRFLAIRLLTPIICLLFATLFAIQRFACTAGYDTKISE